jgi:CBS domain-containing protein
MTLRDIMTTDVHVIAPDATIQAAARLMQNYDIGSVPVCDGTRLQGVITDRDIAIRAVAEARDPLVVLVRDIMTPDVVYGTEDQSVEEAARLMEREQIRRLVVLDADKNLVGVVALGDLATKTRDDSLAGGALEAISQPSEPARAI